MKLYSIAAPSDLVRATDCRFRKILSEVAEDYADLISGRLDRAFSEGVMSLPERMPDTPASRAWIQTIASLMQSGFREEPVPSSALVAHLEADSPDVDRLLELLCWEGLGATRNPGLIASTGLPSAPPRVLSIGIDGSFFIGGRWPTSGAWKLCSAENVTLTGPDFAATAFSFDPLWKPNVRVLSTGIDAVIPLNTPALINRDFQDFPMIRSDAYAAAWAPVLRRAADAIGDYSTLAAGFVRHFVRCVVPLVGGEDMYGSASREQALGLVFLPGTDRLDLMTECLLHETMHQYLFRIEECADLFTVDTDVSERYYSPWRSDPRPLRMTLHGAFVFAAVADLYQWEAAPEVFRLDRRECIQRSYHRARQVRRALDTVIGNARLTNFGQIIVETLEHDIATILNKAELTKTDQSAMDAMLTAHSERYASYAR